MNREITSDVVAEYAGDVTNDEAEALVVVCEEEGIFDEAGIKNCDDESWNQLIIRAVERAGNRKD